MVPMPPKKVCYQQASDKSSNSANRIIASASKEDWETPGLALADEYTAILYEVTNPFFIFKQYGMGLTGNLSRQGQSINAVRVEYPGQFTIHSKVFQSVDDAVEDIFAENQGQYSNFMTYDAVERELNVYSVKADLPAIEKVKQYGLSVIWLPHPSNVDALPLLKASLETTQPRNLEQVQSWHRELPRTIMRNRAGNYEGDLWNQCDDLTVVEYNSDDSMDTGLFEGQTQESNEWFIENAAEHGFDRRNFSLSLRERERLRHTCDTDPAGPISKPCRTWFDLGRQYRVKQFRDIEQAEVKPTIENRAKPQMSSFWKDGTAKNSGTIFETFTPARHSAHDFGRHTPSQLDQMMKAEATSDKNLSAPEWEDEKGEEPEEEDRSSESCHSSFSEIPVGSTLYADEAGTAEHIEDIAVYKGPTSVTRSKQYQVGPIQNTGALQPESEPALSNLVTSDRTLPSFQREERDHASRQTAQLQADDDLVYGRRGSYSSDSFYARLDIEEAELNRNLVESSKGSSHEERFRPVVSPEPIATFSNTADYGHTKDFIELSNKYSNMLRKEECEQEVRDDGPVRTKFRRDISPSASDDSISWFPNYSQNDVSSVKASEDGRASNVSKSDCRNQSVLSRDMSIDTYKHGNEFEVSLPQPSLAQQPETCPQTETQKEFDECSFRGDQGFSRYDQQISKSAIWYPTEELPCGTDNIEARAWPRPLSDLFNPISSAFYRHADGNSMSEAPIISSDMTDTLGQSGGGPKRSTASRDIAFPFNEPESRASFYLTHDVPSDKCDYPRKTHTLALIADPSTSVRAGDLNLRVVGKAAHLTRFGRDSRNEVQEDKNTDRLIEVLQTHGLMPERFKSILRRGAITSMEDRTTSSRAAPNTRSFTPSGSINSHKGNIGNDSFDAKTTRDVAIPELAKVNDHFHDSDADTDHSSTFGEPLHKSMP